MIIYQITNIVNKKTYIGKTTKSADERLYRHVWNSKSGQTHLYRAMRKHGVDKFEITILENVTDPSLLNEREIFWIAHCKPDYNMTKGGEGGDMSHLKSYQDGIKKHHQNRPRHTYASNGFKGKKTSEKAKQLLAKAHSKPVMCEGIRYSSICAAEAAYPGVKVVHRLNSDKWPDFYRL